MSWSISVSTSRATEFDANAATAKIAAMQNYGANAPEDQVDEAISLAKRLIQSRVLGDETKAFVATLSGHGNPGHTEVPGMANDTITVTVSQVSTADIGQPAPTGTRVYQHGADPSYPPVESDPSAPGYRADRDPNLYRVQGTSPEGSSFVPETVPEQVAREEREAAEGVE